MVSRSSPRVGVLALQGDIAEHRRILDLLGADALEVRNPEDLDAVDALILPGGESTTISLLLDSSGLTEPLHKRLAAGMPAFGTCAGMILLAREILDGRADQHRFGAIDISVRRNAFGRQVDSFETTLPVFGLDAVGSEPHGGAASMHAVFIRAPLVERTGPHVEVLATVTRNGVERPVVCREGRVLVAAYHPELSEDPRLHRLFLQTVVA